MASNAIELKAELRTEHGSGAAGRLRRAGIVPGAVNRIGGETVLIKVDEHNFKLMLRDNPGDQLLVALSIDGGKALPVLMREVQFHPVTGLPIHVDFGEISMTEKTRIAIPVNLEGEPEGVKTSGGVLQQVTWQIDVECLPTAIVDNFTVDVSNLDVGQSILIGDMNLGDDYLVLTDAEVVVATVAAPRVAAATSSDEEGDEAAGEGGEESSEATEATE